MGYGLLRVNERFDNSDTVKFVFINWVGESIHRMLRARMGTHSGAIKGTFVAYTWCRYLIPLIELLAPYHVTVDATNHSEISEEIVISTVSKASGTAVHVLDTHKVTTILLKLHVYYLFLSKWFFSKGRCFLLLLLFLVFSQGWSRLP